MIEQHINAVEKPHKRENINRKKIKDGFNSFVYDNKLY